MKKIIISVLGKDRPGIIAAVTKTLFEQDCNIENVSQTILQNEFSGIFISLVPESVQIDHLQEAFEKRLSRMGLFAFVKTLEPGRHKDSPVDSEPFVITTRGPDRKGLVAEITEILARHRVNVTNLQAVFKGGADPNDNIMIYEVDIPSQIDRKVLAARLKAKAEELELEISIQHKKIFEAINRV